MKSGVVGTMNYKQCPELLVVSDFILTCKLLRVRATLPAVAVDFYQAQLIKGSVDFDSDDRYWSLIGTGDKRKATTCCENTNIVIRRLLDCTHYGTFG